MAEMKKIATRESYGAALAALGGEYKDVVVLDADLSEATKTALFKEAHPERFFNTGIAEGNMMGVAAGLSTCNLVPFASTFAMFAAGRAFEQVRNSIGYPRRIQNARENYPAALFHRNTPRHDEIVNNLFPQ